MRNKRRECGRSGGSEGDYTIIQITAGNNLVADVSRSTMPTTHRRACVCVHTPTDSMPSEQPQGEKTAADKPARTTQQPNP